MAINFALSAARARTRNGARDTRVELKQAVSSWRERRENDLRENGLVIPLSDWLGHNNGPPLLECTLFLERQWRAAQAAAFAPPDDVTGVRWAEKARNLAFLTANIGWNCLNADAIRRMKTLPVFLAAGQRQPA